MEPEKLNPAQFLAKWIPRLEYNQTAEIEEVDLQELIGDLVHNFTMRDVAGYLSFLEISRTSGIDLPHLRLTNPNITGAVNSEQRGELYMRDNGDFEHRNVTGRRHVWRAGHFQSELMALDGSGNLNIAGAIRVNGQLIGNPTAVIPEDVEWISKPSTPTFSGNYIAVGTGQFSRYGTPITVPAANLFYGVAATGKKFLLAIATRSYEPAAWEIFVSPQVDTNLSVIFPVIPADYLTLTFLEITDNGAASFENQPPVLKQEPGNDPQAVISQKAIQDNYALKTDINPPYTEFDKGEFYGNDSLEYSGNDEYGGTSAYSQRYQRPTPENGLTAEKMGEAGINTTANPRFGNAYLSTTSKQGNNEATTNIECISWLDSTQQHRILLDVRRIVDGTDQRMQFEIKADGLYLNGTPFTTQEGTTAANLDFGTVRELGTANLPDLDFSVFLTKTASVPGAAMAFHNNLTLRNVRRGLPIRVVLDSKNTTDTLTGFLATNGTVNVIHNGLTNTAVKVVQVGYMFTPGVRNDIEIQCVEPYYYEVFINPSL